jgi:signal transduction histidine kinase
LLILFWTLKLLVFHAVPAVPYSLIVLLVLIPTLLVVTRADEVPGRMLTASFAADICAVTAGIHFGGGVDNVSGPLLYALIIGLAGLILSGRAAYWCAAMSALCYGLVGWGEQRGILVHHLPYAKPADDAVATVIAVSVYLFVAAWIVSYAARQVRGIYQRIEESRREAVSALSHDLKNPLGTIDGYAEMVADATPTEREEYLRRIRQSARQALDLVRNELDAAAVEGRAMVVNREPVDINEVVEKVADVYRAAAGAKGVRLTTVPARTSAVLTADAQLLSRAIGNLVSNAIKYTDAGGVVEITTAFLPGRVTVSVRDNGCGIAPAIQASLFQKYSRVATSAAIEGSGLGLYIVRRVAEAHGGSVSIVSDAGQGSTFTLSLPCVLSEPR